MEDPSYEKAPPERKSAKTAIIIAGVLAVLGLGAGAYLLVGQRAPPAPSAPAPVEPVAPRIADAPLPTAAASDGTLRGLLGPVSHRPQWQRWLQNEGLLERWAALIDNLVEDVSPRRQLGFLAPTEPFSVVERGSKRYVATASYARYDAVGDMIESVDAARFAAAVRALHPLLESAYHALGYPDRPLDPVVQLGLRRLANAKVAQGELEVRKDGRMYRYVDTQFEEQAPIEKHLLRMGPRNTKIVQAKAREVAAALGMSLDTK